MLNIRYRFLRNDTQKWDFKATHVASKSGSFLAAVRFIYPREMECFLHTKLHRVFMYVVHMTCQKKNHEAAPLRLVFISSCSE